jgi:translation elongation factor EF-1beta
MATSGRGDDSYASGEGGQMPEGGSGGTKGLGDAMPKSAATPLEGWGGGGGGGGGRAEKDILLLDVFPEDPGADMAALERDIRSISLSSAKWGEGKFEPSAIGYGVSKLRVDAIIEGGNTQEVQDAIANLRRGQTKLVKSCDFVAFTKC